MLYDPKWEVQTKPDVFSLEGLIAWLEQQPPETAYDWYDIAGCLICSYLKAHGYEEPAARPGLNHKTIKNCGKDGYFQIGLVEPWTFGAALDRARAALSEAR